MAIPNLGRLCICDAGERRKPTPASQLPPLWVSSDNGNLQLSPLSLAPQKVEIQFLREEVNVPRKDEDHTAAIQPSKPVADGDQIVMGT
jgi:hypothetical protein